jgi:hypothetical protein
MINPENHSKVLIIVLILFFYNSCNYFVEESENKVDESYYEYIDKENKNKSKIEDEDFVKNNLKAVLIGKNIILLNQKNDRIEDITSLKGQIVNILELSKEIRYNKSKHSCNEYLWAKINVGDKVGYVDATFLYEINEQKYGQKLKVNTNEITIIKTKPIVSKNNYDSILEINLDCFDYNPIVIRDSASNYFGTLKNIASKYQNKNEEYFTFYDYTDNYFYNKDSLLKYKFEDKKWYLLIRRKKKDYNLLFKVAIFKTPSEEYVAEIIDYGKERPKKNY